MIAQLAYQASFELVFAACVVAGACGLASVRELARTPRTVWGVDAALMVLVGAIALVARLVFSPWGFVHETGHAWLTPARLTRESMGFLHGLPSSQLVVGRLLQPLLPGEQSLFAINIVLSALSVCALYVVVRLVWSDRLAAVLSALALALLPYAIAFSASEEALVFAGGVLWLGLAAIAIGAHTETRSALWCGAALVALAAMTRIVTLPYPAAGLVVLFAATPADKRPSWRSAAIVLGVPLALLWPRLILLLEAGAEGSKGFVGFPVFGPFGAQGWVWAFGYDAFVPTWLQWAVGVAALVVTVVGLGRGRAGRRHVLLVWGLYAVVQGAAGLVHGGMYPSIFRHQFAAASVCVVALGPALVALFGPAMSLAGGRATGARRAAVAVGVAAAWAALLASSALARTDTLRHETPLLATHHFYRSIVPLLDGRACLVSSGGSSGIEAVPTWFAAQGAVGAVVPPSRIQECVESAAAVVWVVDQRCYVEASSARPAGEDGLVSVPAALRPDGTAARMTAACAELLEAYEWREVAGRDIDTRIPILSSLVADGYPGANDYPIEAPSIRVSLLELRASRLRQ